MPKSLKTKLEKIPKNWLWVITLALVLASGVALVYYWRVFYYLDARGFSARTLTAGVLMFSPLAVFVAFCVHKLRAFHAKVAVLLAFCGALFVFANPPMQAPDESLHFLRSYSISLGRFDFNFERLYDEDVSKLMSSFPGAWVNAHTSQGATEDENGNVESYNSSGFALKQWGENGEVFGIADGFSAYFNDKNSEIEPVHEPLSFAIFPYIPSAFGMAIARFLGANALACFYVGRLFNLAFYVAMCTLAIKNCARYKSIFLAIMFMPISLYMASSLNYDALLLGCYWYVASFYCREKIDMRALCGFFAVFVSINFVKPWISLLFIAIPLFLPSRVWHANFVARKKLAKNSIEFCTKNVPKWVFAVVFLLGATIGALIVEWYGTVFRHNYPVVERMLGETVNGIEQLIFVLSNPLRTISIFVGTLYENDFFLGQLGIFGYLDLPISFINMVSPLLLLLGVVFSINKKSTLPPLPSIGLLGLSVAYITSVMAAIYLTYTPVGMVRIIGLQARYFLPAFLMLAIVLCSLLSRVFTLQKPEIQTEKIALPIFAVFGIVGAVLIFQHYFIGPVYTVM